MDLGGEVRGLVLADFTGLGFRALAAAVRDRGVVAVVRRDAAGRFLAGESLTSSGFAEDALAVDLTGDGRPDLVETRELDNALAIRLNQGNGSFDDETIVDLGPLALSADEPVRLAAADFNGDGIVDLAVGFTLNTAGGSNGRVAILLRQGDGTYVAGASVAPGNIPRDLIATDLNGDGAADLALISMLANGTVQVFPGDGAGGLMAPLSFVTGNIGELRSFAAGDFDGDGDPDLVVGINNGPVNLYLGNGNGTFATPAAASVDVGQVPNRAGPWPSGTSRGTEARTPWSPMRRAGGSW